eukprot:6994180-Alexandrium_andersonii.AAC.1
MSRHRKVGTSTLQSSNPQSAQSLGTVARGPTPYQHRSMRFEAWNARPRARPQIPPQKVSSRGPAPCCALPNPM